MSLTGEFVSRILLDKSDNLSAIGSFLCEIGIKHTMIREKRIVRRVCELVVKRAARIAAAAIVAVVMKMDPALARRHTVAIDGSVYEKLPGFSSNMRNVIREIVGKRSENIKLSLTKDGSGQGAAIAAAMGR
jgi:hexokinase